MIRLRAWRALAVGALSTALSMAPAIPVHADGDPCSPVVNAIVCENSLAGDPPTDWRVSGAGDLGLQGFATQISVNVGETVSFKINSTTSTSYHIDILRMGWYQGNGARKLATIEPSVSLPQSQPPCLDDPATGLVDCGDWAVSASWQVPQAAVSGLYFAHLVDDTKPSDSQIFFVVRNDASHSDLLYQTSDTTWEAYNQFGGNDFYVGSPGTPARAYKISYNRPFTTNDTNTRDWIFNAEYPMIRFLEENGYDVSYSTDLDTDVRGSLLENHRVFMSVGHDEYWSASQRSNVQAARDAGVDLAFFSGNTTYWETRWEPSIDGSDTANRTLVCYKETWQSTPIDPMYPSVWTGTWRDTRFSPPANGGQPENALQGNISTIVQGTMAIHVPADDGRMRFWRNTSVATQQPGQVATLADNTLGYEWNEDLDNGFRPPGTFDVSTTTGSVTKLADYGGPTATFTATATHHLTEYRAPSGALVFGAGTVQWSLGLDGGLANTPGDPRMQQATVNLFADMGVQPGSLMAGLVPATQSTDTTPPASAITSPAPGTSVANGSTVTITGTAADTGGGVVGGVEVSTDNGVTWHPATGRESWVYTWNVAGAGTVTIESRAVDDSGNLETPSDAIQVTVNCPCTLFPASSVPQTPSTNDASAVNLGLRFTADRSGFATGVRFYKATGNTGTHVGSLWTTIGQLLASATFANETPTGWQEADFANPVALTAQTQYVVSYLAPNGHYAGDHQAFTGAGVDASPLHAPRASPTAAQGLYRYGTANAFPNQGSWATNSDYWVDVVFTTSQSIDLSPPTVSSTVPAGGATFIGSAISATFSKPVQPSSIALTLADGSGHAVPGTITYDGGSQTATLTLSAPLAYSTPYTATVNATGTNGTPMTAPFSWSFTTPPVPTCPCMLWPTSPQPAITATADANAITVGVKFRSDVAGTITGLRFYKGKGNTGTHVGSIWSSTGALLGSATFTNESMSGWQQVAFANPIAVTAGALYVASYLAPGGHYADNSGYFGTAGVDSGVLHALRGGVSGPDGVYHYGATSAFPTTASPNSDNYWVDVVFEPSTPSTTAPTVTATTPAGNATGASLFGSVSATFSEPVVPASTGLTLTGPAGAAQGTTLYDSTTRREVFTPSSPLAPQASYTATIPAATDLYGNTLAAPVSWTFTTGTAGCPCTALASAGTPAQPSASDAGAIEVGGKFTFDIPGFVTGVRFYKGAGNTGTHVGNLWTASGQNLATATFTNETASGWQTVAFSPPVAVTPGTVYVASYYAPAGHYADTPGGLTNTGVDAPPVHLLQTGVSGPDGVYTYGATSAFPSSDGTAANYWVDTVFEPAPPGGAPSVAASAPAPGATGVAPSAPVTVTFDRAVQPATIGLTVAGPGGTVPGTVTYDPSMRTATFRSTGLTFATTYTVAVSGATDLGGTPMASPATWSFSTATAACPCSIWPSSATPAVASATDTAAVEVGTQFRSDVGGSVTGALFYRGSLNAGPHAADLWTSSGQLLATATFTNETASGWQQVTFSQPVAIAAGQTYVISYSMPHGRYSYTTGTFAPGPRDSPPLHALGGVYSYGAAGTFPTHATTTSYWVDLIFTQ